MIPRMLRFNSKEIKFIDRSNIVHSGPIPGVCINFLALLFQKYHECFQNRQFHFEHKRSNLVTSKRTYAKSRIRFYSTLRLGAIKDIDWSNCTLHLLLLYAKSCLILETLCDSKRKISVHYFWYPYFRYCQPREPRKILRLKYTRKHFPPVSEIHKMFTTDRPTQRLSLLPHTNCLNLLKATLWLIKKSNIIWNCMEKYGIPALQCYVIISWRHDGEGRVFIFA